MIINCGLKRIICSLKDGGYKVFNVDDWVKEWTENDIIDDKFQYGVELQDSKPTVNKKPIKISATIKNKIAKKI